MTQAQAVYRELRRTETRPAARYATRRLMAAVYAGDYSNLKALPASTMVIADLYRATLKQVRK